MKQIVELPLKIGKVLKIKDEFYRTTVSGKISCSGCDFFKKCTFDKMKSFCPPWSKLKLLNKYEILFLDNTDILILPLKENDVIKLKDKYYRLIALKNKEFNCKKCCFENESINFCSRHLDSICNKEFIFEEVVERRDECDRITF